MKHLILFSGLTTAVVLCAAGLVRAADEPQHADTDTDEMAFHKPDTIEWTDGPPSLAEGAEIAVLEGNPAEAEPFTFRLRLPDGFEIQPHWHPQVERVTVLSGTFHLGMGEVFDREQTEELPTGTYGYWSPGMRHFAWAEGETVLQLHGHGPWEIVYLNPEDDPRRGA
jgi:hypothetical protein